MLDGKILAAVFASLTAIAAALNGGGLDASQLKSSSVSAPGEASFSDIIPDSLVSLGDFFRNPVPETDFTASLEVRDTEEAEVSVKGARLLIENMTSFGMDGKTVKSDNKTIFYGFQGSVNPADPTRVSGTAQGFVSSGVNVSGTMRLDERTDTRLVRLEDVKRSRINLDDVTGTVSSNSTSTEISDDTTNVRINSFSGSLRVYPDNGTFVFDGKVDRLEAGNVRFG